MILAVAKSTPTVFEWWAYIWIPALLGLSTLIVSAIALVASSRATRIARQVELQRENAANERAEDAALQRLQDMAIDDARAIMRYAVEWLRPQFGSRSFSMNEPPPPRTARDQAAVDATVQLEHSLVPGARTLLAITKFDLDKRHEHLPDDTYWDAENGPSAAESLRGARDRRMYQRIRMWAFNPELTADGLEEEFTLLSRAPENYLKIGYS